MLGYWLCAFVGAGVGAVGAIWYMRQGQRARLILVEQQSKNSQAKWEATRSAWTSFAVCTLPLIPILIRQMHAVTDQTERAVMDLMARLQTIASRSGPSGEDTAHCGWSVDGSHEGLSHTSRSSDLQLSQQRTEELGDDVNQIVTALQFQDITRQKLEHVKQALTHMQQHLQHLIDGRPDGELHDSLVMLKGLEHSYTMESERQLHILSDDGLAGAGKVRARMQATDDEDSVTIF